MIKIERAQVLNLEGALRGMRNPLDSWEKSDSGYQLTEDGGRYVIGPADRELARKLVKAGSDHRKFLRQIFVSVDITAPLYWWKEFDTYKVGTVANSCSTMHRIHSKPITVADFSTERLSRLGLTYLEMVVEVMEMRRRQYVETHDQEAWDDIIQLLFTSYNQLRTVTLSFENLLSMYHARKNHKLPEWRDLCREFEKLPHFRELCLEIE
jgi:hypothetical protein